MARFDAAIKTAQRLIAKNGQMVAWRVINDPEAPTDQPWNPGAATPEDKPVRICFLPADGATLKSFGFMKGTEVPKGAVMGLMGAVPFEPNLKDVVIRDGRELRIEDFNVLSPNGQIILYTVLFKE